MLQAPAGVRRAFARLRPDQSDSRPDQSGRANLADRAQRHAAAATAQVAAHLLTLAAHVHLAPSRVATVTVAASRRQLDAYRSSERSLSVGVAALVVVAALVSFAPALPVSAGATSGDASAPRIAIAAFDGNGAISDGQPAYDKVEVAGLLGRTGNSGGVAWVAASTSGPLSEDGTLLKPAVAESRISDGKALLTTYTVRSGDTLTGIASSHGVSMMTIWWANKLTSKDSLHPGQELVIPPVSGLIVTVKAGDTLESLAATNGTDPAQIVEVNQLDDPNLIIGQTLVLPGAAGAPIPTPKPAPRPAYSGCRTNCGSSSGGGSTYIGGKLLWPVIGGNNYISQYFRYGHYAVDIAASYGSTVRAAGAGTILFAGWKRNGGGWQVWIAHGGGVYTTYNHMSRVSVGTGQSVGRGQKVGAVGQSGRATGPHLHFEVWKGAIWNGGTRVNPLPYLR